MSSWIAVKVFPRSFVLFSTKSPLSSASTMATRTRHHTGLWLMSLYKGVIGTFQTKHHLHFPTPVSKAEKFWEVPWYVSSSGQRVQQYTVSSAVQIAKPWEANLWFPARILIHSICNNILPLFLSLAVFIKLTFFLIVFYNVCAVITLLVN